MNAELLGARVALRPGTLEDRSAMFEWLCRSDVSARMFGPPLFREGSGGDPSDRRDPRGYWLGHLAFAYHHIEPSVVIVSIGDFDGRPRQFGVVGNGPDRAEISAKDGIVRYELVYAPYNSNSTRIEPGPQIRGVQGVLLVQLIEVRKLLVEVFPGKTATNVSHFTESALVYER